MEETYIGAREAAKRLGIDPKTLARWRKAGKIPYRQKVPGAHPEYPESVIEAMLNRLITAVKEEDS